MQVRCKICTFSENKPYGMYIRPPLPTYQVWWKSVINFWKRLPLWLTTNLHTSIHPYIHPHTQAAWQRKSKWSFQHSWRPTKIFKCTPHQAVLITIMWISKSFLELKNCTAHRKIFKDQAQVQAKDKGKGFHATHGTLLTSYNDSTTTGLH